MADVGYSTAAGPSEEQEQPQVRISPGEDAEQVQQGLKALLEKGWVLDGEGMGIQKTFYFRTYFKSVVGFACCSSRGIREADCLVQSFMNVIASQSAIQKHHSTMTVVSSFQLNREKVAIC
jgi:4a-hydroxytetrahydrobiopterin dehydratase